MTNIQGYEIHPTADLFPMLQRNELVKMAKSIKENGLREAIVRLGDDGPVIDGRNRLEACFLAMVEPRFRVVTLEEIGDVDTYIADTNLVRRHLNESQRATIAARMATRPRGVSRCRNLDIVGKTASESAEIMGVSRDLVMQGKRGYREAPDLMPKVEAGEMSLHAVIKEIDRRQGKEKPSVHSGQMEPGLPTPPARPGKPKEDKAKKRVSSIAMGLHYARRAIEYLDCIEWKDHERSEGFSLVRDYMSNKEGW